MGDAAYKTRKRAEWQAAGLCVQCGRPKPPEQPKHCARCLKKARERVARGDYRHDNRERPRVDGNWIFA